MGLGLALFGCAATQSAGDDVAVPKAFPISTETSRTTDPDAGARGEAFDTSPPVTATPAAAVTAQATPSTPTTTTPSSANPTTIGFPQQPRPTVPAKKK